MQPLSIFETLYTDFDHRVFLFPTRSVHRFPNEFLTRDGGHPSDGSRERHTASPTSARAPEIKVRTRARRGVVVLEFFGPLSDAVQDLDRAIQLALAEGPRGVVCDLSSVRAGGTPDAVEALGSVGRHVRSWQGVPVAVACPDPVLRAALVDHPLGEHLIVTASRDSALLAVQATPPLAVERLRLGPCPTAAQRAALDFVTQTLPHWGLESIVLAAGLVLSELVGCSNLEAGAEIELSFAKSLGALRVSVRGGGPDLPPKPYSHDDPIGRRLSVVAVLSRAHGVLPASDGRKVVWAVLKA